MDFRIVTWIFELFHFEQVYFNLRSFGERVMAPWHQVQAYFSHASFVYMDFGFFEVSVLSLMNWCFLLFDAYDPLFPKKTGSALRLTKNAVRLEISCIYSEWWICASFRSLLLRASFEITHIQPIGNAFLLPFFIAATCNFEILQNCLSLWACAPNVHSFVI